MPLIDAVKAMLERPVAFQPILGRICGSATAGLMLSQAVYWSERAKMPDGWFFKTIEEWQQEICLSRHEQDTARRKLRALGFWKEKRMGVPCRVHYRVDLEALAACISQFAENRQTGLPKTGKPACRNAANLPAGMRQASLPETGNALKEAETTSETTADIRVEVKTAAVFLMKDGSENHITQLQVDKWQRYFPKIDVEAEVLAMAGWLDENPDGRKTQRGLGRFVIGWLKREQAKLTGAAQPGTLARSRRPGKVVPMPASTAADIVGGRVARADGTYPI